MPPPSPVVTPPAAAAGVVGGVAAGEVEVEAEIVVHATAADSAESAAWLKSEGAPYPPPKAAVETSATRATARRAQLPPFHLILILRAISPPKERGAGPDEFLVHVD